MTLFTCDVQWGDPIDRLPQHSTQRARNHPPCIICTPDHTQSTHVRTTHTHEASTHVLHTPDTTTGHVDNTAPQQPHVRPARKSQHNTTQHSNPRTPPRRTLSHTGHTQILPWPGSRQRPGPAVALPPLDDLSGMRSRVGWPRSSSAPHTHAHICSIMLQKQFAH
jgi:hypothetical protein